MVQLQVLFQFCAWNTKEKETELLVCRRWGVSQLARPKSHDVCGLVALLTWYVQTGDCDSRMDTLAQELRGWEHDTHKYKMVPPRPSRHQPKLQLGTLEVLGCVYYTHITHTHAQMLKPVADRSPAERLLVVGRGGEGQQFRKE